MSRVVITGGGSGLGQALAYKYADQACQVAVVDIDADAAQTTVDEIDRRGGRASSFTCDITKQDDVDLLAQQLSEQWGAVDTLINNAGVAGGNLFEHDDVETWQWLFDINVIAQVRVTKAILPLINLSQSADKTIINIASQAGITASAGMSCYCASKAAIVSFSESLHIELDEDNIHVCVVCPAFFETNLHKSLRTNQPEMKKVVEKLITQSGVSASEIADKIVDQSRAKDFMIVTHAEGRKFFRLKRFLPTNWYMKLAKQAAQKLKQAI